jgi:hypothetical protein
VKLRRLVIAAPATAALAFAVTGCATSSYNTKQQTPAMRKADKLTGHEVADDENDGAYVSAGALTYQLEISRELNQYGTEDKQYIHGLPKGYTQPNSQQLWYGVFMWAKNQTNKTHTTTDNFSIEDTQGDKYYPVKLDPKDNPFAWHSQALAPGTTEPGQDTAAAQFYTGGKILLFKLPTTIYNNRPLTLYINNASGKAIGKISLDL